MAVALGDLATIHAGFLTAFVLRFHGTLPVANFKAYLRSAPGLTLLALVLLLSYGLYDLRPRSWRTAASGVVAAVTLLTAFGMALSFVLRAFAVPRSVFLLAWVLNILLLLAWRNGVWRLAVRSWGPEGAVVVGPAGEAEEFAQRFSAPRRTGYQVTAVTLTESREGPLPWFPDAAAALDEDEGVGRPVDAAGFRASGGLPVYPLAALPALLRGEAGGPPPDVLVVTPSTAGEDKARVAALAALAGARLLIVPSYRDLLVLDTRMTQIDDTLAFEVGPSGIPAHLAWAKRLMDIGFALAGLALTLPLYPLVAAAVALSSPGPVFYRQARVGLGGRVYTMWKFRTMVADAEAATGAVLAKADDPRVTPVGRVLRRFRLDELPQLLNVLAGSMSVVGPRPERPEFAREYARMVPYYEHRHHLKPGLTGLAQLSVRYDTPVEEKLRYDLLYAKRYSLLLDLRIIFLTAKVVLMGEEAHWTPES